LQSYHVKPKTDKSEAPLVAEWACNVAKGEDETPRKVLIQAVRT
jgi:hypothetical protein